MPLTNADSKAAIKTAIDGMIAYWHAGTYIPAGLIWGWHVLTKGEPFTQGLGPADDDYEDTVKAMVLLTDGDNQVEPSDETHNNSNYTSYSYVNTARIRHCAPSAFGSYRLRVGDDSRHEAGYALHERKAERHAAGRD